MRRNNNPRQGRYNNHNNGGGGSGQRPRKNYRALQEKYLNMAREAMGSGDRILAEYYLQHADHYFRMQAEFMEERNRWNEQRAQTTPNAAARPDFDADADDAVDAEEGDADGEATEQEEVDLSGSSSALPAFLTRQVSGKDATKVVPMQNWEERDAD